MGISEEEINEAMDNEFDGIEDCVLVEEILELKKKIKGLEGTIEDWYKPWERDARKYLKILEDNKICSCCGAVNTPCVCPFG